jgi:hypothetical protein
MYFPIKKELQIFSTLTGFPVLRACLPKLSPAAEAFGEVVSEGRPANSTKQA